MIFDFLLPRDMIRTLNFLSKSEVEFALPLAQCKFICKGPFTLSDSDSVSDAKTGWKISLRNGPIP